MVASIIVGIIVAAILGFAIYRLVGNKKSGKSACGCGCGCSGCKMACPSKTEKK